MTSHDEIASMLAVIDTQLPEVSPIIVTKATTWRNVRRRTDSMFTNQTRVSEASGIALQHLKPEEPNVSGHSKYYESTPASLLARMAPSTDQNHIWGSTRAVSTCFGQNLPPHTPRPPDVDDPTTREKTYLQTPRRLRPYNSNWKTYARIQNSEPISSQHYPELPRKPDPDQG